MISDFIQYLQQLFLPTGPYLPTGPPVVKKKTLSYCNIKNFQNIYNRASYNHLHTKAHKGAMVSNFQKVQKKFFRVKNLNLIKTVLTTCYKLSDNLSFRLYPLSNLCNDSFFFTPLFFCDCNASTDEKAYF